MSQLTMFADSATLSDSSIPVAESPANEGPAVSAVAEIDSRLREGAVAWRAVVDELETARRNLVLATAELQTARRVAANQKRAKVDDSGVAPRVVDVAGEEARCKDLLESFEGVRKESEVQRLALHGEMEALRQRRNEELARLGAPTRAAYDAAERSGRVPVISAIVDNACSSCAAAVPVRTGAAIGSAGVVVCSACGRLLRPAEVM